MITIVEKRDGSSSSLEHQTKLNIEEKQIISQFSSLADGQVSDYSSSDEDDYAALNPRKSHLKIFLLMNSSSIYEQPMYPLTFIQSMSISDYVTHYSSFDPAKEVSLAGLIMDKRHIESESTFIYELHCLKPKANAQVQVIAKPGNSYMEDAEFSSFHCSLKPGVFLGVSGLPVKREKGEPAICPSSYTVLTRQPKKRLPVKVKPDSNIRSKLKEETSSLKRYQEIKRDRDVAPIFELRYEIVNYINSFLQGHNFLKGGTSLNAVPRQSSANDCMMSFRSRPPLLKWHKRMSCGHNYAYELGKKINKGINLTHFTTLIEFELCIDFQLNDLLALTERILSEMVEELIGVYKIKCHANGLKKDPIEIDFNPPFSKIDIMEELDKLENLKKPEDFSGDAVNKYLTAACTKYDIKCPPGETNEELLDKVVKYLLEKCVNPTFILYHPNIVSRREKCGFTRQFKLFVNKHEVFNGYVALENRFTQIQRIWNIKDRPLTENEEIALEYGLVETGGWSLGIDQLTLLLTNAECITKEKKMAVWMQVGLKKLQEMRPKNISDLHVLVFTNASPVQVLGFMCKAIIDVGRLVKYVPSNISPGNNLLVEVSFSLVR